MLDSSRSSLAVVGSTVEKGPASGGQDTAERVRLELWRILNCPHFDASERNRRFLEYVVEETLAGRGHRIKAYSIATIVFGRDDSFDPTLDPVVRMEARRLRRSLERFYLVEGEGGAVRILLPKGGYVPKFQNLATLSDQLHRAGAVKRAHRSPSILIAAFEPESENLADFRDGLARRIVVSLSRFPELALFMQVSGIEAHLDQGSTDIATAFDFVLSGDLATLPDMLKVTATLLHAPSGRVVWAQTLAGTAPEGLIDSRDRIADLIARAVWERTTALDDMGAPLADANNSLLNFASLGHYIRYRRAPRLDLYLAAQEALETAVDADPDNAEGLACLSQINSDGHRFGFSQVDSCEMKRRALELALRAVDLKLNSSRAHHALGVAHWFLGNARAGLASLNLAVAHNPNAADAVADLGLLFCLSGDWESGARLIEEAASRGPLDVGVQRVGLALFHFSRGNFEHAYKEALQVRAHHVTPGFVAKAISLVRLGRREEAADAVRCILGLDPLYGRRHLHDLGASIVQPALAREIVGALQDAGLTMEEA